MERHVAAPKTPVYGDRFKATTWTRMELRARKCACACRFIISSAPQPIIQLSRAASLGAPFAPGLFHLEILRRANLQTLNLFALLPHTDPQFDFNFVFKSCPYRALFSTVVPVVET